MPQTDALDLAPPHGLTSADINHLDVEDEEWKEAREQRCLPMTLYYCGTEGMREAREKYLPREVKESDASYNARLGRTVLTNLYLLAVNGLVDRVIAGEITSNADVPVVMAGKRADPEKGVAGVEGWLDNIDRQGNAMTAFAMEWLRDAVNGGLSAVFVDYPPQVLIRRADGSLDVPSRPEERALGRRPFCVRYSSNDIIGRPIGTPGATGWRIEHMRVREHRVDTSESVFAGKRGEYVRYFRAGDRNAPEGTPESFASWHLFRKVENPADGAPRFILDSSGSLRPHVDLPIVILYGRRKSFGLGDPVFASAAELQGQHWAKQSDLDNGIHLRSILIWHRAGVTKAEATEQVTIAHGRLFWAQNSAASMQVVEAPGAILGIQQEDLKSLEERIRLCASEPFTVQDAAHVTATSDKLRNKPANSQAESIRNGLEDAMNSLLLLMARWEKPDGAGGTVNIPSGDLVEVPADVQFDKALKLTEAPEPALSARTLLELFAKLSDMPTGWTVEEEMKRLAEQKKDAAERSVAADFMPPDAGALPPGRGQAGQPGQV